MLVNCTDSQRPVLALMRNRRVAVGHVFGYAPFVERAGTCIRERCVGPVGECMGSSKFDLELARSSVSRKTSGRCGCPFESTKLGEASKCLSPHLCVIRQFKKRNVSDLIWRESQNYQEYTSINENGKRYIRLDVRKHYLIALGYVDSFTCHMNLKLLALLNTVSQPPQFFEELFHKIVLLDIAFTPFLLRCHLQSPLIHDLVVHLYFGNCSREIWLKQERQDGCPHQLHQF
jgi:hypothetical protein